MPTNQEDVPRDGWGFKDVRINGSVNDLADSVERQADDLFPDRTDATMFLKLFGEIGELVTDRTEEEYADVMIMLLDFGARKGFNIEGAVLNKMRVNDKRKWNYGPDGVAQHVD